MANFQIAFPHLSRENSTIQKFAKDPQTANRWAVKYRGEIVSPRSLKTLASPRDETTLGTHKEARLALRLVGPPDVEFLAVFLPDGKTVLFPVEIPVNGKSERGPEVSSDAPDDLKVPSPHPEVSDAPQVNSVPSSGDSGDTRGDNVV